MSRKLPKDWQPLQEALVSAGWTYAGMSSGTHMKYRAPEGHTGHPIVTLPTSPSDHRSLVNTRAMLRRAGVPVPSKG